MQPRKHEDQEDHEEEHFFFVFLRVLRDFVVPAGAVGTASMVVPLPRPELLDPICEIASRVLIAHKNKCNHESTKIRRITKKKTSSSCFFVSFATSWSRRAPAGAHRRVLYKYRCNCASSVDVVASNARSR